MNYILKHHGILGQRWGKRNGPPYPLGASDHSASEKKAGWRKSLKKSTHKKRYLSDKQKKYIAVGVLVAGTVLATYGAYKIHDKRLPTNLLGVTNPKKIRNNCKDVAEATLKRWLGVDPSAVAGENTITGNLHDFIEKKGYNKKGVKWISLDGGIMPDKSGNSISRVTNQILKKYNEGDCGFIGVDWNPEYTLGRQEAGHAFNWFISDGKVKFIDDQPDPPIFDASKYLTMINPNKEIEVVRITKEAFEK